MSIFRLASRRRPRRWWVRLPAIAVGLVLGWVAAGYVPSTARNTAAAIKLEKHVDSAHHDDVVKEPTATTQPSEQAGDHRVGDE